MSVTPGRDAAAEDTTEDQGEDRDAAVVGVPGERAMSAARRRLDVLRGDVERRLLRLDADERAVLADRADATADDEHDPEGSTLSGEWTRIRAFRSVAQREREEIDAALARVSAGTYGRCARCGREIPPPRLEARPMATLCVECA